VVEFDVNALHITFVSYSHCCPMCVSPLFQRALLIMLPSKKAYCLRVLCSASQKIASRMFFGGHLVDKLMLIHSKQCSCVKKEGY